MKALRGDWEGGRDESREEWRQERGEGRGMGEEMKVCAVKMITYKSLHTCASEQHKLSFLLLLWLHSQMCSFSKTFQIVLIRKPNMLLTISN